MRVAIRGIEWQSDQGRTIVRAGAGEDWDAFVAACVERDLAGVECLSGIPGSVGGTPVQNVGAYGQEIAETLVSVRAYDRHTDRYVDLDKKACGFSYRSSIFNTTARDRYIVVKVAFKLDNHGTPSIRYPDLERELENSPEPTLRMVRDAVRRIRARKAMLIEPGDPDCRSAGSFFKNPIVTEDVFARIEAAAGD